MSGNIGILKVCSTVAAAKCGLIDLNTIAIVCI